MNKINGRDIIDLKRLIVDTFTKSDWIEMGYLVNENELIENHPRLLRSMDFGDDDYEGNVMTVLKTRIDRNPNNYDEIKGFISERSNTPVDSMVISTFSEETPKKTLVFSPDPEIFKIPDKVMDDKLVSVMMPFHAGMTGTIDTIKKTCKSFTLDCKRADDIWDNNTFIQDIFDLIFVSKVVIADFTERNPNVFYEVGVAHALGKTVIPITQSIDDVPADLRHHRVLKYLPNGEGFQDLERELTKRLSVLFPNP